MQRFLILSGAFILAFNQTAQAGPIDPTVGFHGDVRLGTLNFDGDDPFRFYTLDLEADVMLAPSFGIAAEYEVLGEFGDEALDRYAFYLYYSFLEEFGLGFGWIPSPIDALLIEDRIGYPAALQVELETFLSGPFVNVVGFDPDEEEPLGVMAEGTFGNFQGSASVHVNQSGAGEVYSLVGIYADALPSGLRYAVGGGVEYVDADGSPDIVTYYANAELEFDEFDVELTFSSRDFGLPDTQTVVDASVGYTPDIPPLAASLSGSLRLGADYTFARRGGAELHFYGLGAELTVSDQFGIGLSAGRRDSGGSEQDYVALEAFFTF